MPTQRDQLSHRSEHDPAQEMAAWAASGAMTLTGRRGEPPLGPPAGLVPKLTGVADRIEDRSAAMGRAVRVDPLALLAERAAVAGFERGGTTSCGGATRLLAALDGWLAVTLAREDDAELVPAWLEQDQPGGSTWDAVAHTVQTTTLGTLLERGVLVGLPLAALPSEPVMPPVAPAPLAPLPLTGQRLGTGRSPARRLADLVVADLSALWAGPLCGSLLAAAGAQVIKVESMHRPDGARRGAAAFFDLLNAGKRSVAVDLRAEDGRRVLRDLVRRADIVIEASRPRALEQLGIIAEDVLGTGDGGPRVWASITGHGRRGPGRERVAFGDDAAVAGGLVCWDDQGPCFCADAIADPATGLVATAAILDALGEGSTWLLDVSMAGVAAHLAGPTLPRRDAPAPSAPKARPATGRGPDLGADTDAVLAWLGAS